MFDSETPDFAGLAELDMGYSEALRVTSTSRRRHILAVVLGGKVAVVGIKGRVNGHEYA